MRIAIANTSKKLIACLIFTASILGGVAFAASWTGAYEVEGGALSGTVSRVADANASGGDALKFETATSTTCNLNATTANFAAQVSAATAGQVICLATGNYGEWGGTNKAITITAQAGATPTISLALRSGDCCFTIDGGRQSFDATTGIIINGDGGPSVGSGVRDVTIKNTKFTSGFRFDGTVGAGGIVNANILLDHNLHVNLTTSQATAAVWLSWGQNELTGITIQNSLFRDMSADGIQTGSSVSILNNEFSNIKPSVSSEHTDAIQSVGGSNIVIKGNYIHEGEQAIGMFDGTGGNVIEHNVIKNFTAHWISLGGDRPASVVQFNTIVGTGARLISCPSKSGYQPSLTIIRNNIAGDIETTGTVNCSPTENRNNMLSSAASGQNFTGIPAFVGGSNPNTFLGYLLAAGSPGIGRATDGSNVGIHP